MQSIKNRIKKLSYGSAFVVSDFTDIASYENAKKCLLRLEKDQIIRRVLRGVYDKPFYSQLIGEYSFPNIEEVAAAIARNYNRIIAPSGIAALNLLGLSTQVSNTYEYYSSGQYKNYTVGKIIISFKHKSSKELLNFSYKSSLVIQAIKEIGPNIDEETITRIRNHLNLKEKERLLKEASETTKWVYEIVKKI